MKYGTANVGSKPRRIVGAADIECFASVAGHVSG